MIPCSAQQRTRRKLHAEAEVVRTDGLHRLMAQLLERIRARRQRQHVCGSFVCIRDLVTLLLALKTSSLSRVGKLVPFLVSRPCQLESHLATVEHTL